MSEAPVSATNQAPPPQAGAHPPVSIAIQTIGVCVVAMVGSSVSSQLVDLAIADVGGAFSVSADQASWIACVATMAEVAAIPIAAILVRALSLRTVVICAAGIYALAALGDLGVADAAGLLVVRAVQSFAGGILSVLLFVSVMATLPAGPRRGIGLTVFAFASTAPGAFAASVGASLTERFGWQGLYGFDLGWSLLVVGLAAWMLRPSPPVMRLSEIDWPGYLLLATGCAALILFLKQGDRFFWWDNPTIVQAGLFAATILPISIAVLLWGKRPLLDLSLLLKPSFGWAVVIATFYRFGLVMTAFVVPQALVRLQGFRMPEIADANIWMLWAECIAFPLAWFWASRWDARLPLSLGLALFAIGAALASRLTPAWQAADFRLALIAIGFGQGLFLVPTLFYATRDVAPTQGPTAAALFNLSRVGGQVFGIAVIGSLITWREKFHSAILVDRLDNPSADLTDRLNGLIGLFTGASGDRGLAELQAWKSLAGSASIQAYTLAFADAFVIVALVLAASAFLVLMLPPLRDRLRTRPPTSADALASGRPA